MACITVLIIVQIQSRWYSAKTRHHLTTTNTSFYCPICDSNKSSSRNGNLLPTPPLKRDEERHQQQQQNILWYHPRLSLLTCLYIVNFNVSIVSQFLLRAMCIIHTTRYLSGIIMNQCYNFSHSNVKFNSSPSSVFLFQIFYNTTHSR